MMHGRPPVSHLFPLQHVFPKVDISDPHTFLAIKRGILQYAWLKPLLGIAAIAMKATGTYKEGYVGLSSGYFWSGIIYNISITLSLYSLGMFWICMSEDLKPFRPVPKFLCVKLIIFASYWQGFLLSILVWLGAITDDVKGYTPDNIAAAVQAALICFEMPAFAVGHWYAFSWHDYADITISSARMPMWYAFRDAFGIRDLIEDTKMTFGGGGYEYRQFDSGDNVLAHEESESRVARMMEGMRYERGGKGKYWIPKPGEANSRTPLLGKVGTSDARTMSPSTSAQRPSTGRTYSGRSAEDVEPLEIDQEDERLFSTARALEFGDWNVSELRRSEAIHRTSHNILTRLQYPVLTANVPSRERWMSREPTLITTSTNRNLLQPTKANKARRESKIKKTLDKGKNRDSSSGSERLTSRAPGMTLDPPHPSRSTSSVSGKSGRSQLVDLVVEDKQAEETERVRARKEGGAEWNESGGKRFVYVCLDMIYECGSSAVVYMCELTSYRRTYPDSDEGEETRQGEEPSQPSDAVDQAAPPGADDDETDEQSSTAENQGPTSEESQEWKRADGEGRSKKGKKYSYGSLNEERSAWSNDGGA